MYLNLVYRCQNGDIIFIDYLDNSNGVFLYDYKNYILKSDALIQSLSEYFQKL